MKLLWLTLNSSWSHSSLALPMVHTACRRCAGWEWRAFSGTVKDDLAVVASGIAQERPDLVCAPLYIFNCGVVLEVLGRIRALLPSVRIAVGGPECLGSGARELVTRYDFIDFACQGEGEVMMPALLEFLATGHPGDIPGIVTRGNLGSGESRVYEDWSAAPLPCLDEYYDFSKPFVQVETSRGCPNHCTFCTSAGTSVRYRPLGSVRQELDILRQRGIREIRLLDRTFNMPPSRAVELLRMFRNEYSDMHFHLEFNPCLLPLELREELQLAQAGQLHIEAGMQSMHEEVLNAIGRINTCERACDGLRFLCSMPHITVHSDLISGLPQQTLDGLFEDVERMSAMGPGEIQLEVLKILKGTALETDAAKFGMVYSPSAPYDVMRTPWMTAEDIIESRYLSKLVDLYYNAESLQAAFRMCLAQSGFLRKFMAFLRQNGLDLGPAPALKKRFLWLYEFIKERRNLPQALDALRIAWMKEAFGAVGPCADAQLTEGVEQCTCLYSVVAKGSVLDRETKYYRLVCSDGKTVIFVYNRAIAPNKAVAMYQM